MTSGCLRLSLLLALLSLAPDDLYADLIIDVGDHTLQQNSIGTIDVLVSGGDAIQGLNVFLQLGDGGAPAGGSQAAPNDPSVISIDLVGAGKIFNGNNTGQNDDGSNTDRLLVSSTTTASGTVLGSGTLFSFDVNTNNAPVGAIYSLILSNEGLGAGTDFAGVPATRINNGQLTISAVPEPSTFSLIAICAGAITMARRRQS